MTNAFKEEKKAEETAQMTYNVAAVFNSNTFGKSTFKAEDANNDTLGRNVLKTDLGLFNEPSSLMFGDDLDNRTQDGLISNSRQDGAAA